MTTATDDAALLLRAILTDPVDLTARLVYADCIEERGEPDRAEFIRLQVGGCEDVTDKQETLLFRSIGDVRLLLLRGRERVIELAEDTVAVRLAHGFVSSLTLPTAAFLAHAAALFAAHPITAVTLTDKACAETENEWGWYKTPQDPTAYLALARHVLPAELWHHLAQSPDETFKSWKFYGDTGFALADLSRACVAHGRNLASLPPLTPS